MKMTTKQPRRFPALLATLCTAVLLAGGCKELPVEVPKIDVPIPSFALNCPGVTEHAANVDTFLVIGHRGAAAKEPENTIPSMQRALDDGANALELDFCMTSDGEIVIWHDWDPNDAIALAREGGGEGGVLVKPRFPPLGSSVRKPMDEITYDQFRFNYWYVSKAMLSKERVDAEIPTIQKFMDWAHDKDGLYYLMIDVKIPESKSHLTEAMISKMDSIISSYNPKFKWVYMTPRRSVWDIIARLIDGNGLSFDVDLGPGEINGEPCTISSSSYARQRGHGFATTMHPFTWTETPWTTLKRLLMCDLETRDNPEPGEPIVEKVIAATINDREKLECLVDMGIDGIMTDDPGLLRTVAVQKGRKVQ